MKLKWTRKKPRDGGLYYYRKNKKEQAVILCIAPDRNLCARYQDVYTPSLLSAWRGQWAGPLPEPPKD